MSTLVNIIKFFVGDKHKKDIAAIKPTIVEIKKYKEQVQGYTDDQLRNSTVEFITEIKESVKEEQQAIDDLKKKLETLDQNDIDERNNIFSEIEKKEKIIYTKEQSTLENILPKAFSVVKETARRLTENKELKVAISQRDRELEEEGVDFVECVDGQSIWKNKWNVLGNEYEWNMVHYDVQLMGGVVLHSGKIAEMATGEGKTLVATLPVYLNALVEKGVHVVTVNDYLAKRDSTWLRPFFEFHGLSVDCIDRYDPHSDERKKAYNSHIVYGTNNEFGFDYLRDNMVSSLDDMVQRNLYYAIVDEVDSVLIDDARTPLIISGAVNRDSNHQFGELKPKVERLISEQRKYLNDVFVTAKKEIESGDLKNGGFKLLQVYRGLPKSKPLIKFLSLQGNKQLLQKTENFYLQDNAKEMKTVDKDLLFVIEEKNNSIHLTDKGIECISTDTDKEFFMMPDIGVELAKIEKNESLESVEKSKEKEELYKVFSEKSERIHILNQLLKSYTLFEKDVEYVVIEGKIKIVDEQTGRIMEGRRYSDGLHQALESKENVKIENASQTLATVTLQNYFRMYKKLAGMTGTAETEAGEFWQIYKLDVVVVPTNKPLVRKDYDDKIYKTEREKFNAIVQEVVELTSQQRPVLIGTTSVENSEKLSKMLKMQKIDHNVLNAKLHKKEADIVAEAGLSSMVTIATNMAGRGTDIKISDEVKQKGGLAIIGTERHDSRRVDRQLRGRAGRQGDPGSSQFYISLEDNLMRLFASDRMARWMDRLGLKDGEVIQHSMISKSIERAQKKVEENHFGVRKRLLEYDDVMNNQRTVIYSRRKNSLLGEKVNIDFHNAVQDTLQMVVENTKNSRDYINFEMEFLRIFGCGVAINESEFEKLSTTEIVKKSLQSLKEHMDNKVNDLKSQALPIVKRVSESKEKEYKNIAIPIVDGKKSFQLIADISKAIKTEGDSLWVELKKSITLVVIDREWKEHLRLMDDLRQTVQNAVYEQKDPLLIYKFESFDLFKQMLVTVNQEIISFVFRSSLPQKVENSDLQESRNKIERRRKENLNQLRNTAHPSANTGANAQKPPTKSQPIIREKKYGRNDEVTIVNSQTGEQLSMKYKKAEPYLENEIWRIN